MANLDMTYCNSTTCHKMKDCIRNYYNYPELEKERYLSMFVMDKSQEKDCEMYVERGKQMKNIIKEVFRVLGLFILFLWTWNSGRILELVVKYGFDTTKTTNFLIFIGAGTVVYYLFKMMLNLMYTEYLVSEAVKKKNE